MINLKVNSMNRIWLQIDYGVFKTNNAKIRAYSELKIKKVKSISWLSATSC